MHSVKLPCIYCFAHQTTDDSLFFLYLLSSSLHLINLSSRDYPHCPAIDPARNSDLDSLSSTISLCLPSSRVFIVALAITSPCTAVCRLATPWISSTKNSRGPRREQDHGARSSIDNRQSLQVLPALPHLWFVKRWAFRERTHSGTSKGILPSSVESRRTEHSTAAPWGGLSLRGSQRNPCQTSAEGKIILLHCRRRNNMLLNSMDQMTPCIPRIGH